MDTIAAEFERAIAQIHLLDDADAQLTPLPRMSAGKLQSPTFCPVAR